MTSDALTESTPFLTTDGEIARANLESARGRSWSRFFADPVQTRAIEAVLEHEQLTAQFVGEVSALDRVAFLAAELATVDAASAPSALIQARVASMLHRFAEARDILAQAEIGGRPNPTLIGCARISIRRAERISTPCSTRGASSPMDRTNCRIKSH